MNNNNNNNNNSFLICLHANMTAQKANYNVSMSKENKKQKTYKQITKTR
jgi:hypothetical protein